MAIGDIQHSELPDNLLHEPKGASTAAEGTLYIANGTGSGSFKKVPLTSLDFSKPTLTDIEPTAITPTASLNGSSLSQVAAGILTDVAAFVGVPQEITSKINQNASELLRVRDNQAQINRDITNSLTAINTKLTQIISALREIGLIND